MYTCEIIDEKEVGHLKIFPTISNTLKWNSLLKKNHLNCTDMENHIRTLIVSSTMKIRIRMPMSVKESTYGSKNRIRNQDLSLGHHHLGRIDQGTRLGDLKDFNSL